MDISLVIDSTQEISVTQVRAILPFLEYMSMEERQKTINNILQKVPIGDIFVA
jgi:hypothetical protein